MLRRHSTKSKSDLHRRKSTTSVRSVHLEHIDAAVAQRDAQTAAMEAFSRAQGRQSAERALFPPQPTGTDKENRSPAALSRCDSTASLCNGHSGPGVERRQSVRFIGPESRLQTRSSRISMRTAAPESPEIPARRSIHRSQSTQSISYVPRSVLRNSENLPLPDRTSSVGKTLATPEAVKTRLSQAYLEALTPEYEQYTPEDDIASMPSSYRRVRKTRSTLTARASIRGSVDGESGGLQGASQHSTSTSTTAQYKPTVSGTLFPRYQFMRRRDTKSKPSTPNLRAPKSMSFLKSRRDRPEKKSNVENPDGGSSPIIDTRDSFQSHKLPKPPNLFEYRCAETRREIPKALRGSSADTESPASATGANLGRSRSGSLRNRARKVSTSLKSRIKNLFINKSEEGAGLPAQQIEAQRTHVSDACDEMPWATTTPEQNHCRERSSLSRVSTRFPSLHAVPSHERLHSPRASIDSCRSAAGQAPDERSRVTSWASTDTDTIIAHRTQESTDEWEKQRLSIINEHGMRNPSPSLHCPTIGLQTITSQEELAPPPLQRLPPGATVDSQRVYSALIKKMNETQQYARIVEQQRKSSDGSDPFRTLSPSSSNDSSDSGDMVAPTQACALRKQVPNSGKEVEGHPRCERAASDRSTSMDHKTREGVTDNCRSLSPPIHLTPQGRQRPDTASTITDRGSAFFGSPTSHLFRTTSPYRRSLQRAMRAEREALCQDAAEETVETTALTEKTYPTAKVAYSESSYSSDTLIHKTETCQEDPDSQPPNLSNSRAEASVFVKTSTYRPTGERQVSTASSLGWKTWLSADVAKLEPSPTRVSGQPPEVEYRIPTMPKSLGHGHVREAAQTGTYEEDEQNAKPTVRMPTSSATPLSTIDSNVVKLSPQQRSVMRTTTPPAADPYKSQFPLVVEHNTLASVYDGGVSNIFGEDASRPPASPSEETGPSSNDKAIVHPQTPIRGHGVRQSRSLAGLKSISRIREPQTGSPQPAASSTVRLMRKSASKLAANAVSAASTPGFTGVFERQFGSTSHQLDGQLLEKENQVPRHGGAQQHSPYMKGQFRGSKAMVDLFLSSRRRQGASGGDGIAFV